MTAGGADGATELWMPTQETWPGEMTENVGNAPDKIAEASVLEQMMLLGR